MTAEIANALQTMPAATGATARGKRSLDDFPKTEQVSFIIKHTVKPGENERYEAWLRNIIAEAAKFHGHQGVHIVRPTAGSHGSPRYRSFGRCRWCRRWC